LRRVASGRVVTIRIRFAVPLTFPDGYGISSTARLSLPPGRTSHIFSNKSNSYRKITRDTPCAGVVLGDEYLIGHIVELIQCE